MSLEEREIRRIGGTQSIKVDVCVIAATNKDLIQAVRDGTFRDDLYFRLNVIPLARPTTSGTPRGYSAAREFLHPEVQQ